MIKNRSSPEIIQSLLEQKIFLKSMVAYSIELHLFQSQSSL